MEKQIIYQIQQSIREHQVAIIHCKSGYFMLTYSYLSEMVERLAKDTSFKFDDQLILIGEIGLLNGLVKEPTPLLYDILEMNEKPLEMILPEGQFVPSALMNSDGDIRMAFCKVDWLNQVLYQLAKSVVAIKVKQVPNGYDHLTVVQIDEHFPYINPQVSKMRLGKYGEVKIFKK